MINPFVPGAGHRPPFLAGRENEKAEFARLAKQTTILENLVLTGLRGVGKTVLLDELRPMAQEAGWVWTGTDLSESASLTEDRIVRRLLTDLALVTSTIRIGEDVSRDIGFGATEQVRGVQMNHAMLTHVYESTPGLVADKLKATLELVWAHFDQVEGQGIVFAYDEAQNLSDQATKEEFPLSLLLDVFQSLQRRGIPFMLVLTGLPTLFPKLVEARTYTERMFHVVFLQRLSPEACRDAIVRPIEQHQSTMGLGDELIEAIVRLSGGYPYFIQFICREVFELAIRKGAAQKPLEVPMDAIVEKLDTDFFSGRWGRATDRQRDLMRAIAALPNSDGEFSVQDVVESTESLPVKKFSSSHVAQMLVALGNHGMIYKNRYGKYSFAVPLMDRFISRIYKSHVAPVP